MDIFIKFFREILNNKNSNNVSVIKYILVDKYGIYEVDTCLFCSNCDRVKSPASCVQLSLISSIFI